MSQNQDPFQCYKPITVDLAQLTCSWQVIPISTALIEVGVPQIIPADGSGLDVVEIAQKANVNADLLFRYLHFMSSLGVFKEMPNRYFAHNESSKILLPGNPTFYHMLFWSNKNGIKTAAEFATHLRNPSKSAFEHALNISFYQYMDQTPELEKHFGDYMAIISNQVMPDILKNIELPDTGIVADEVAVRAMRCSNFSSLNRS